MARENAFELSMPGGSELWQTRRDEVWGKSNCHARTPRSRFPLLTVLRSNLVISILSEQVPERLEQAYNFRGSQQAVGKSVIA
jgi:hypothetical protein